MSETDTTTSDHNEIFQLEVEPTATVKLGLGGKVLEFPSINDWPHKVSKLMATGDLPAALETILKDFPETLEAVEEFSNKEIKAIFEKLAELAGVNPGELPSSAKSSRSTAKK